MELNERAVSTAFGITSEIRERDGVARRIARQLSTGNQSRRSCVARAELDSRHRRRAALSDTLAAEQSLFHARTRIKATPYR